VNKNGDKDDPQAYCAQVHKNITGEFPGQNQSQSKEKRTKSMLKIITTRYSGLPKVTKYKLGLYIFANDELKNMLA